MKLTGAVKGKIENVWEPWSHILWQKCTQTQRRKQLRQKELEVSYNIYDLDTQKSVSFDSEGQQDLWLGGFITRKRWIQIEKQS